MHLLLASPLVDSKMALRPVIRHSRVTCGRRRGGQLLLPVGAPPAASRTERDSTNSRECSEGGIRRSGASRPAAGLAGKGVAMLRPGELGGDQGSACSESADG